MRFPTVIGFAALILLGSWTIAGGESLPAPGGSTNLEPQMDSRASPSTATTVGRNLLVLVKQSWKDAGLFAGKVIGFGLLGAVLLSLGGGLLGLAVWLVLRRRGVFTLRFGWYRYVRWLWCPLFVVCFTVGFAYAGMA